MARNQLNFEVAKAMVPEYIMLKVGAPLRKCDETLETPDGFDGHGEWIADCYPVGHGVGGFTEARRPIPEEVRDAMARNIQSIYQYGENRNNMFTEWLLEQSQ